MFWFRWNATFLDYSSHIAPNAQEYGEFLNTRLQFKKKKSWVSLVKEDIKSEDLKIYSWSLCDIWHKDVWIHKCVWKYLYIHIFVYVHTFACMSGCWAVPTWVNVWGCLCVQLWGTSLLAQVVQLSHWTVRLVCCVFKVSLSLLVLVLQSLTISV